jgi:hypothetical protein
MLRHYLQIRKLITLFAYCIVCGFIQKIISAFQRRTIETGKPVTDNFPLTNLQFFAGASSQFEF